MLFEIVQEQCSPQVCQLHSIRLFVIIMLTSNQGDYICKLFNFSLSRNFVIKLVICMVTSNTFVIVLLVQLFYPKKKYIESKPASLSTLSLSTLDVVSSNLLGVMKRLQRHPLLKMTPLVPLLHPSLPFYKRVVSQGEECVATVLIRVNWGCNRGTTGHLNEFETIMDYCSSSKGAQYIH